MTAAATHRGGREARQDRREGGRWTPLQTLKNAGLYALARLAIAVTSPLPRGWLAALGRALGRIAYAALPGPRRVTLDNIRRAFPSLSRSWHETLAREVYVTLGGHLADTVALLSPRHSLRALPFDPASRAALAAAVEEGRGVVFVSAHLGPWEAVAGSLVAAGVPLTAIAREGYDPRFTGLYDALRSKLGVGVIYRGRPGAHAGILRALRRGRVLGVPMDLRSRVASVDVPFLGVNAPTAVGPARIALRTGARVVVGTAAPSPDGLCVTVTPIESSDLPPGARGEEELTTRLNAELSRRIRAMPEGWVWMHPRWA